MADGVIANPIVNSPYVEPARHFLFDDVGVITDTIADGRRPSESWVPIPKPSKQKKGRQGVQSELVYEHTVERRLRNDQVDQIRARVRTWRVRGYPDVTPTTRRLLEYWSDPERANKVMFCQREAAETAIYIAEAAPKQGDHWIRNALDEQNQEHNDGLPRLALKMATGSGKTVVLAMLVAWHTLNKVASPQDARFSKRFLVVTPGITIRDRLRVLLPADDHNYYRERDLVPADLWGALRQAQIVVTNFHTFLVRDTREGKGISANTKLLLTKGKDSDPFQETPDQMVNRALRELGASRSTADIVVLNDEAHHCYRGRAASDNGAPGGQPSGITEAHLAGEDKKEARERNKEAGIWFSGLAAVARKVGIKAVYDLSATPFFLKGSGYPEGYLFPWVVSDFSLMDAIESGIVKIPRVPVDDDSTGEEVTYLHLWDAIGGELPKKAPKAAEYAGPPLLPAELEGALHSLYGNYRKAFERHEKSGAAARGEPPPVFIVVCNNTTVSKLVYDFVAGWTKETDTGDVHVPGALDLLSNVANGRQLHRPRTILIDSAQLESGDVLSADFKKVAAAEVEAYKSDYALRYPGRDAEAISDEDMLREVMNTVGKPGRLGEGVRCVVSVSMLTEGWDANTVTHILGVRAFGSQLLCEQVVGRGLRRRSYVVNDDGFFEPEYAEVYGVPFSFIRTEPGDVDETPRPIPVRVQSQEDRSAARIEFPKLEGYRVEVPDAALHPDFVPESRYRLTLDDVATRTKVKGVVGLAEEHDLDALASSREQQVAFGIAKRLLERHWVGDGGEPKRWLFPQLVEIARRWLVEGVTYADGAFPGLFRLAEMEALAAERVNHAILILPEVRAERILPVFRRYDPVGSTDDIDFFTTKKVYETDPKRCPVNYVVLDGKGGNLWEQTVAQTLETLPSVSAYVKNDHLEFVIPYVHAGQSRRYLPDFLVRLAPRDDDVERTLVVEVSGTLKSEAMSAEKAETARNMWCAAVNNHGGYGRWGFIEVKDPYTAKADLVTAIKALYEDGPVTGLPS